MKRRSAEVMPDAFGELIGDLRFRSAVFAKVSVTSPWGIEVDLPDRAMFHFVAAGECRLEVDGAATSKISEGDLVIFPHGHAHTLRDRKGSTVERIEVLLARHRIDGNRILQFGSGRGPKTSLICGGFWFDDKTTFSALRGLPPMLLLRANQPGLEWLRFSQELIARELSSEHPGASTIAARLADAIFIEAARTYFAEVRGGSGLSSMMHDPSIGLALTLINRDVRKAWTVAELARDVGLSRSAFALRFQRAMGETPMKYLARRRIDKAARLLRTTTGGIGEIALEVGYKSESAFSRAFAKHKGTSPARARS